MTATETTTATETAVCDLDCQTCRRPLCTGACAIMLKPRTAKRVRDNLRERTIGNETLLIETPDSHVAFVVDRADVDVIFDEALDVQRWRRRRHWLTSQQCPAAMSAHPIARHQQALRGPVFRESVWRNGRRHRSI